MPDVRLPTVSIGDLSIPEGDSPGNQVARVPFEVHGALTSPARVVVTTVGQERGQQQRFAIDLAPGQTSGSIPVGYSANDVADYGNQTQVAAWAVRGIQTDDYLGELKVIDDDPQPVLDVSLVKHRVVEGQSIVLRATISELASYDYSVYGQVVDGPGTNLRANDVKASWLKKFGNPDKPHQFLYDQYVGVYDSIAPGETQVDLVVPTSRDSRKEGKEKLTVLFRIDGERFKRTVTVVDAR